MIYEEKTMDELGIEQEAEVLSIGPKAKNIRRRLQDLGFVTGNNVKCVNISPAGDPKAYKIADTVVAIRKVDAQNVCVRSKKHASE